MLIAVMVTLAGFPYFEVSFDEHGAFLGRNDVRALQTFLATNDPTDLFVIAHGWNGAAAAARSLYRALFEQMRLLLESRRRRGLEGWTFAILGILWAFRTFEVEEDFFYRRTSAPPVAADEAMRHPVPYINRYGLLMAARDESGRGAHRRGDSEPCRRTR